jgi:hypothetical protein
VVLNLQGCKRHILAPMDCFVNALEVFGLLDVTCATIMRIISSSRNTGFTIDEVQKIFIFLSGGLNFDFMDTLNYAIFEQYIINIPTNHGIFAGYSGHGLPGHIFIIAKTSNGVLMYIDAHIHRLCLYIECKNLIEFPGRTYHLLFHSLEKLTFEQLTMTGFNF